MNEVLLALALLLPGVPSGVSKAELKSVISDVVTVAISEPPIAFSENEVENRIRTAKLLIVWSFFESAWKPHVRSGEHGEYIGTMQVHRRYLTHSIKEVLGSRVIGLTEGLTRLRSDVSECGTVRSGLARYSSGSCNKRIPLIEWRCKIAGC